MKNTLFALLTFTLLAAGGRTLVAAPVTWDAWQQITGDADVAASQGTLVKAYAFGPQAAKVQGVEFRAFSPAAGDAAAGFDGGTGADFSSAAAPLATLSAEYRKLVSGGLSSKQKTASLALGGLTRGQWYSVQIWVNDSRASGAARSQRVNDSPFLCFNADAKDGGLGVHITGWFQADATSQKLDFTANESAQLNALQLRAITAPDPLVVAWKQRRQFTLNSFLDGTMKSSGVFPRVHLTFATGQIRQAREAARSAAKEWGGGKGYTFDGWPAVDMVIRWKRYIDAETREHIRKRMPAINYVTPGTANLMKLAWTMRFLGSEEFGEDSFEHPKNDYRPSDPTTKKVLLGRLSDEAKKGGFEFASSDYGWDNILPTLTLAQLSRDPEMQARAATAFPAMLAQFAAVWQKEGYFGTWSSRNYEEQAGHLGSLGRLLWGAFGDGPRTGECKESGMLAAMNYMPPLPLLHAANDRSTTYDTRARTEGFQSAHVSGDDYVLFSQTDFRASGSGWCYGYGVRWRGMTNFLSLVKPATDNKAELRAAANHGKMMLDFATLQHRDSVLFAFDISHEKARDPRYALGYVPGGYQAIVNDAAALGRIFIHYGPVMVAVSSDVPFAYDPQAAPRTPRAKPQPGDSDFRVGNPSFEKPSATENRFAMAIETALPAEYPGATPAAQLAAFREHILKATHISHDPKVSPTIATYTNRHGDKLWKQSYDDNRKLMPAKINGQPVDYTTWPMLENPWMTQDAKGGPLTITGGGQVTVLDFSAWSVTTRAAAAVASEKPAR